MYAEIEYALAWKALPEAGYPYVQAATAAFPFDQRFRLGTAYYTARRRWTGSRQIAEAEISMALMTDPYAMDLRKDLAGLLFEDGDKEQMQQQMRIIHYFQPKVPLAIQVNVNPVNR